MRANPTFTLVNIAIAVTEGIGKQLDPDVDLMAAALPFFAKFNFFAKNGSAAAIRSTSGSSCLPIPSVTAIAMLTSVKVGLARTRCLPHDVHHVENATETSTSPSCLPLYRHEPDHRPLEPCVVRHLRRGRQLAMIRAMVLPSPCAQAAK